MNLFIKLLILIIKRLFDKSEYQVTKTCSSFFRVDFFDLDLNFHMNNGRYLSVMDLGRLDLILRTKKFFKLFGKGYYPLVLSESIIFKKSLGLSQKYELQTHVHCWDEKFFYFKQTFLYRGETVAVASVRACFKQRGRKGIVPTDEITSFFEIKDFENEFSDLAKKQKDIDLTLLPRD